MFISWRICLFFLRWTNFCIHVMVSQWIYFSMFPFVNFSSFSIFKVGYVQIMTKFIFKWRKGKHILCMKLNSRFTCMQLDLPFISVFMIILSFILWHWMVILTALSSKISTEILLELSSTCYQKQNLPRLYF